MDKKTLIVSIASLVLALGACVCSVIALSSDKSAKGKAGENVQNGEALAAPGSFVYFQLDRVIKEYDMANDLTSVVESKMQNVQEQLASRQKKLQKDYDAFQEKWQKGLMTQSTAQAQMEKLEKQKQDLEKWASAKQAEMLEEQQVTMNQIMDAIQSFLVSWNEEKAYAMIFANQGSAPIITADGGLDITDELVAGLNEEYVQNKNKKD